MKVIRLLPAILREIFEESAYERFCVTERLAPGRESYSMFVKERRVKVKCC